MPVAYRETALGTAEAEGKIKKQSGGHGQFAVVRLRVSPRGRGEGNRFVDAVVGGAVPRAYLPAVERGVMEALARENGARRPRVATRGRSRNNS